MFPSIILPYSIICCILLYWRIFGVSLRKSLKYYRMHFDLMLSILFRGSLGSQISDFAAIWTCFIGGSLKFGEITVSFLTFTLK
jgi:hypothetical protein